MVDPYHSTAHAVSAQRAAAHIVTNRPLSDAEILSGLSLGDERARRREADSGHEEPFGSPSGPVIGSGFAMSIAGNDLTLLSVPELTRTERQRIAYMGARVSPSLHR